MKKPSIGFAFAATLALGAMLAPPAGAALPGVVDVRYDAAPINEPSNLCPALDWGRYGFDIGENANLGRAPIACAKLIHSDRSSWTSEGSHYLELQGDHNGCIFYNPRGVRKAAVVTFVDGSPQPLSWWSAWTDGVEIVCGDVNTGRGVTIHAMACDDATDDNYVDVRDILVALQNYGQSDGAGGATANWNYKADYDERVQQGRYRGTMQDILMAIKQFGVHCDNYLG